MSQIGDTIKIGVAVPAKSPIPTRKVAPTPEKIPEKTPEKTPAGV